MSVAPLTSEFVRGRPSALISERRRRSTTPSPFSAESTQTLAAVPPANVTSTIDEQADADCQFTVQLVDSISEVRGYARRLAGDSSDAGDLVQEACRRALESRDMFIAGSDMRAWLCCIIRNLYRDRLRRLAREVLVPDYDQSPAWSPERRPAWALVSDEDLELALASLQPQYQQAYVRYTVGGQSYQEIARDLQVPSSTVGTRILRARLLLREFLNKRIEEGSLASGISPRRPAVSLEARR